MFAGSAALAEVCALQSVHSSRCCVEKVDKSCELLAPSFSDLIVTLSPPPSSSSSSSSSTTSPAAAAAVDRVAINTTVYVRCRNSSLVLSGSAQLTCLQNASWDRHPPTCQRALSFSSRMSYAEINPSADYTLVFFSENRIRVSVAFLWH